jgi:hypothetical protein
MFFIRKVRKTKRRLNKSSFIISLPKRLQRKVETQNKEISVRLENFTRFHYFYNDIKGLGCFLLTLWSDELPSGHADKTNTTTIQKSGKSSRYVLIPKKICNKYGWDTNTDLVIGLDYQIDEFVHESIYGNNGRFVKNNSQQQSQVCVIKFQRYQDMKKIYRQMLANKKTDLAKEESDAYWTYRNNYAIYDMMINRINSVRKQIHRIVWNRLVEMNLVSISYNDFVKLRSQKERERKRKRREFLSRRYGDTMTWRYRKDLVRFGRRNSNNSDTYYEDRLDNPDEN